MEAVFSARQVEPLPPPAQPAPLDPPTAAVHGDVNAQVDVCCHELAHAFGAP